jgi:hypothetical protein
MEKSIPLNRAQGYDAGALTTKFVAPYQIAAPARMLGLALVHRHKQWKHAQYMLLLFVIFFVFGHVKTAAALTLADLQGPWQAALIWSGGGCGPGTAVVNFDLDGATGTTFPATFQATTTAHGTVSKCSGVSKQTLTIESLDPVSNQGIANLTCGTGCGWTFAIQVHPDGWIMYMVDVTDPGNFIEGTAIRQPHNCPPYCLQ